LFVHFLSIDLDLWCLLDVFFGIFI
jgi:hypothetical protein